MVKFRGQLILAAIWLVSTLSLAIWWMVFSMSLIERLGGQDPDMQGHRQMLMMEGGFWMVLLLGGGSYLIYFIFRDRKQLNQVRQFVAAFSHDLKTSLASMRLQTESLKEDLSGRDEEKLADRLLADTLRLQIQLENSLILASGFKSPFFIEPTSFKKAIEGIQEQWPNIKLVCESDCVLQADSNALRTVISNLVQNAIVHGASKKIVVRCQRLDHQKVKIEFEDDGKGFHGDYKDLGRLFERHNPSSGSGVGLYIVKSLVEKMNGSVEFYKTASGHFGTRAVLQGSMT